LLWHPDLGLPWSVFILITVLWAIIAVVSLPIYPLIVGIIGIVWFIQEIGSEYAQPYAGFWMGWIWPIMGWSLTCNLIYEFLSNWYYSTHPNV